MTIQEVARRAGVSKATVSRALNQPQMVKPATRERVMSVVRELDFSPNPFAQSLNTGKTFFVALVVPNLTNPFFAQVAEGCDQELRRAGYHLIIANTSQSPQLEREALLALRKRRVAGVVLASLQRPEHLVRALPRQTPLAIIGQVPRTRAVFDAVLADDADGMRQAVAYVARLGHRDVACITGPQRHPVTRRRLDALLAAAAEAGVGTPAEWVAPGEFQSIASGHAAMNRLLGGPRRPTAVLAMSDVLAVGALRAAADAGLRVPGDLAIVGFDDIPLASYTSPSLTTVRSDNAELGRRAARCVIHRIEHPQCPQQRIVLPVELVRRESA